MEEDKSESKETKLREQGIEIQKRIVRRYKIDFDPLHGSDDALEYANWALEWSRMQFGKIGTDNLESLEDRMNTFSDALVEHRETEDESTKWKYLKATIRDDGLEYIRKESEALQENKSQFEVGMPSEELDFPRGLGKALINLALSLPSHPQGAH